MKQITLLLVAYCFSVGFSLAAAPERSAWIAGWDTVRGLSDLRANSGAFDEITIFAYQFDPQGDLVSEDDTDAVIPQARATMKLGAKMMVTVVNDVLGKQGKQPQLIRDLFRNPSAQHKHLDEILRIANAFDGVEIDYEALKKLPDDPSLRRGYTAFLKTLADALHARNKTLAVDIEPEPKNVDWKEISAVVDSFKVMAYYDHGWGTEPGPLITPKTLERILRYAQSQSVPSKKLVLGLPTYVFEWRRKGEGDWKAHELENTDPEDLAQGGGVNLKQALRDENENPHFSFKTSDGVEHAVWYADDRSVAKELAAIAETASGLNYAVRRIAFWRLGRGHLPYAALSINVR